MARELTKNEFIKALRGYNNAQEMFDMGFYKECLFELKPALKLLERGGLQTRFLAKALVLQAKAYGSLNQKTKQQHCLKNALHTLNQIQDESDLKDQVINELGSLRTN